MLAFAPTPFCVALIFFGVGQMPARAANATDPLQLFEGVYEGTIRWPVPFGQQFLVIIEPVLRNEEAPFLLALARTDRGAKLSWTVGDEMSEAWIVGAIGEHAYEAPTDRGLRCRPLRALQERAARSRDWWLACQSVGASDAAPAVLMGLTAAAKSPHGSAGALDLSFKQYFRSDQLPGLDDAVALMLQQEGLGEGQRLLLRDAKGSLRRRSE